MGWVEVDILIVARCNDHLDGAIGNDILEGNSGNDFFKVILVSPL